MEQANGESWNWGHQAQLRMCYGSSSRLIYSTKLYPSGLCLNHIDFLKKIVSDAPLLYHIPIWIGPLVLSLMAVVFFFVVLVTIALIPCVTIATFFARLWLIKEETTTLSFIDESPVSI